MALVFVLLLSGCIPAAAKATDGCDSTSDCPLGTACEAMTRTCVALQGERVIGSFSCPVYAAGDPVVLGTTDVLGELGGDRIGLASGGVLCKLTAHNTFILSFEGPSRDYPYVDLGLSFDPALVQPGAELPIVDSASSWQEPGTGPLFIFEGDTIVYLASAVGVVRFDGAAVAGETLYGTLDLRLVPVTEVGGLGHTCDAVTMCGSSDAWQCKPFVAGGQRRLCYPECKTAEGSALCTKLAGTCANGACALSCATAACPEPTVCSTFTPKQCF